MRANLYPVKIEQPNANKSSGLAGKCLKEVRRDKSVHRGNCTTQKDPKYHHAWSNVSQLKEGKEAQCGRTSSYHCSHKTYYGIKGYRNTCPIAGLNGTYTQPATLRLYFSPTKKKIPASSIIKKVKISISHRCTGVDVANNKEYDNWGPNFSGFKTYPDRSVLTVKFAGQKKTTMVNPPLSKKNYNTISFTFKNVTYSHLANGYVDLIYGNNLSSNPGNIYIKNVFIEVDYDPETPYFEGKQSSKTLYIASSSDCRSSIKINLEAGMKSGNSKIPISKASKKFKKSDVVVSKHKDATVTLSNFNGTSITATVTDSSNSEGTKTVRFNLKGTNLSLSFKYKAKKRTRPEIKIPYNIEHNTKSDGNEGIVVQNGCASKITFYDGGSAGASKEITGITFGEDDQNMLSVAQKKAVYEWLSQLSCGYHEIFFRVNNESDKEMTSQRIKIVPANYKIYFTKKINNVDTKITSSNYLLNKEENETVTAVFEPVKPLLVKPNLLIENPTTGVTTNDNDELVPEKMGNISWSPEATGGTKDIPIGTYIHGEFYIKISDSSNCTKNTETLRVNVISPHKQYFDEIFVRGEDGTAFDYEYLVAMEGDSLLEPVYLTQMSLGASFKDLKICANKENITGLGEPKNITLSLKNTSNNDIENLLLELNTLVEEEDGNLEVTTEEWLDESGIFYNFKNLFRDVNENLNSVVDIKNLSEDDDYIDEENVYLSIKKIEANQQINIKIPFFSYMEKDVYLQILLEDEPLLISDSCSSSNPNTFDKIHFKVYDSVLTEMEIVGDIDIHEPTDINCPLECFKTESGITYKIKNIDNISLDQLVPVTIKNDPRLIPYQYKEKNGQIKSIDKSSYYLTYISEERTESYNINGMKILLEITFPGFEKEEITQYTDNYGYTTFFVDIPKSISTSYDINGIKEICKLSAIESRLTNEIEILDNYTTYSPGETIPIKVKVSSSKKVFKNEFNFIPRIKNPGDSDEITIYYKACNLKNNEGILTTSFETNPYELALNKVEEDILFGVKTNTQCYSVLKEIVIEKNNVNRLFLTIKNKDRFNKDVKIIIKELEDIEKYIYSYSDINIGEISVEGNSLIWSIPYLEKDAVIRGYIDFKAENVGLSELSIEVKDFLTDSDIDFNKKNCDC